MMSQDTKLSQMMQALTLGKSSQQSCQHEESIKHFEEALRVAPKNGFKEGEGYALMSLSHSLNCLGRYEEAIDYGEQGLKLAKEIGDKKMEGNIYNILGTSYLEQGKPSEALEYFKPGFKIALELKDKKLEAVSWLNLGAAYTSMSKYDNGVKCCKKAMELFKQQNHGERSLSECYCNLVKAYKGLGKYYDAIVCAEKCVDIARRLGDKYKEAGALINLASLYKLMFNIERYYDCSKQSLSIAEEIGSTPLQAKCLGNIGTHLSMRGKYEEALPYYLQSLKLAEEMEEKQTQALSACYAAKCYKELKSYQQSNLFYNKSLNITKELGDKETEATVYFNLGVNHYLEGNFQQAISWLDKCLDVAMVTGNKHWESNAYNLLGIAFHTLAKQNQDGDTYQDNLTKSEQYLKKAFDCQDYLFTNLKQEDQLKASLGDQFLSICKPLVSILIETGRTQEALLISDHGRARALGDRLTFAYGLSEGEYVSPKQLPYPDIESVVSNDSFTILHYSMQEESDVAWVVAKDSLQLVKFVQKQEIHVDSQGNLSALSLTISVALSKVYAMMDTGYMNCENRSLDSYVQANDHQRRGDGPVGLPQGAIGQDVDPFEVLHSCFMASVLTIVRNEEIVIVPDGPMYIIPFAALKDPATGQYLSDTKRIRIAPSIAVLKLLQECPADHHSQQGALIIGDPTVGEVILRGKKTTLPPLPKARYETEIIAQILCKEALTGEAATKAEVLKRLQEGAALIHIAAHGSSDNGEIALAPNSSPNRQGPPEEEDYLLTIKEVQETGVRAKLVVLSSCYGGRGQVKAEGMISLSRAFLVAGARAVVASLWAIDSHVTFSFMLSFYTHLNRGKSASVSLDRAMKEIRQEGYTHPRYWAPFFLIGDDVTLLDKN